MLFHPKPMSHCRCRPRAGAYVCQRGNCSSGSKATRAKAVCSSMYVLVIHKIALPRLFQLCAHSIMASSLQLDRPASPNQPCTSTRRKSQSRVCRCYLPLFIYCFLILIVTTCFASMIALTRALVCRGTTVPSAAGIFCGGWIWGGSTIEDEAADSGSTGGRLHFPRVRRVSITSIWRYISYTYFCSNIDDWSTHDLLSWLKKNEFSEFSEAFYYNNFVGKQLFFLNLADFVVWPASMLYLAFTNIFDCIKNDAY